MDTLDVVSWVEFEKSTGLILNQETGLKGTSNLSLRGFLSDEPATSNVGAFYSDGEDGKTIPWEPRE